MKIAALAWGTLFSALLAPAGVGATDLEVSQAGPAGEVRTLEEAKEVRVVFAEPMVALGKIPEPVTAPFFRISPAVEGSLRWAGTRTLIFAPSRPLPFATRYEVAIDRTAASLHGNRLARPYTFTFTTPTVHLLATNWYRVGGRFDGPLVIALRFNQPVSAAVTGPHVSFRYAPHDWRAPVLPPEALERIKARDPAAPGDFQKKVARTQQAASSKEVVTVTTARDWDRNTFPPAGDLLVFQTVGAPPTDAWIKVTVGPGASSLQGPATPGQPQEYTIQLEPTLFVDGFHCRQVCDPDEYNPLRLRARIAPRKLRQSVSVTDVTAPPDTPLDRGAVKKEGEGEEEEGFDEYDRVFQVSLEDVGYSLRPARTYAVAVDRSLRALDGQTLGYTWIGLVENWHQRAFTSFGSGHGVWESSGGPQLPFYARNLKSVTEWAAPVSLDELVPTVTMLQSGAFQSSPPGEGRPRALSPRADTIQSYALDLGGVLSPQGKGLAWAALMDGERIDKAPASTSRGQRKSALLQVTNLGLSVKDSPQNTLVLVSRLDDGQPVEGATVTIRTLDNQVFWTGRTDTSGIAVAPDTALRHPRDWWSLRFVVTAEKDGDVAYLGSDWNQGVSPWEFGTPFDLSEAAPLLRGTIFSDRGVYRLGEEVHLKAVLRSDTARGISLLPGATVDVTVKDSHGQKVEERTVTLSEWSTVDLALKLPREGPLGQYEVKGKVGGQEQSVSGRFLVAAYRRPDFRVDANLAGESSLAGVKLKGLLEGRYLFGGAMGGRSVRWTFSRRRVVDLPRPVSTTFPRERWVFLEEDWESRRTETERLRTSEESLDASGRIALDLETDLRAGSPYEYAIEGEVTDVSRQTIAGRAGFRVDPAPFYVGVRRPPYFAEIKAGLDTEVVAADLSGRPVPGVSVQLTLTQVQWHSVRRAEGQGFYTWETEQREVKAGEWMVATEDKPVPLHIPLEIGGYFLLRASASDGEGRSTTTSTSFYVLGPGYTAWERYDHNRIDLVPERKTYRPGETARIVVKSPWESSTALLTTEREGVRTWKTFRLSSTQETVSVPIGEEEIPNVFVSVLLVKGRTGNHSGEDASDPGKPAFRLGYVQLQVEDSTRRLDVKVESDREEYRPAQRARVQVAVKDVAGRPARSEVTLWAVDYGVLSLTAYRTPDVLGSVYVPKALQVLNEDSRQNIVSRRVTVAKGADEGGGGGDAEGPGTPVRKDFRVLAFWLGSLVTDEQGRAVTQVTLPESLTTYRIMAVAADKASRFGRGEREVRLSKPVLLRAAFPRFLSLGDSALFGSVVNNQLAEKGTAIVTLRSLDPTRLEVVGDPRQTVEVAAKGASEVRFNVLAKATGDVRLQMAVRLSGETDAFEDLVPVRILSSPEVVAAYGQARPDAREAVELPAGVLPGYGGLHVELSSTALVGLGEGARYLVDYPYGCAEQRASAALALMLAGDLGDAFRLPGIEPAKLKEVTQSTLDELPRFQCQSGGFDYWYPCVVPSPYLTSYLLHVFQRGAKLGYSVSPSVVERAEDYLEESLAQPRPENEGWWPAYTAWQSFAVKVLAEGDRNVDSHLTRLYGYRDRMPVFALAYLLDAMAVRSEQAERPEDLRRRVRNAILPEAGTAHVEELSDPYLMWFWNSSVRSTALVLGTMARSGADPTLVPGLVRWLMQVRKQGRWGNTQENATAMEALVDYYKKYEQEVPDFRAVVRLGLDTLATGEFRGRSTESQAKDVAMKDVLAKGAAGERLELAFKREGTGTLHYVARLKYASAEPVLQPLDQGFQVERSYASPQEGARPGASFQAGDLVRVTLRLSLPKERRFVAVTDPLPAGFEPVESWFATTAGDLAREQQEAETTAGWSFWERGGFDHVERHDDRVQLFATRLAEGEHTFSYVVRATTAGTFRAAPARAEEMYTPEVFGRTASATIEVRP